MPAHTIVVTDRQGHNLAVWFFTDDHGRVVRVLWTEGLPHKPQQKRFTQEPL